MTDARVILLSDIFELISRNQLIEIRAIINHDYNTAHTVFKGHLNKDGSYALIKDIQDKEVTRLATVCGDLLWIYINDPVVKL